MREGERAYEREEERGENRRLETEAAAAAAAAAVDQRAYTSNYLSLEK